MLGHRENTPFLVVQYLHMSDAISSVRFTQTGRVLHDWVGLKRAFLRLSRAVRTQRPVRSGARITATGDDRCGSSPETLSGSDESASVLDVTGVAQRLGL